MFKRVNSFISWSLFVCIVGIGFTNLGFASDYEISPFPHWVDVLKLQPSPSQLKDQDVGVAYLLLDHQIKVEENTVTYVEHKIKKILSQEALRENATIEIDFYPQTEHILLHEVVIRRGPETFNQLTPKNIKILQREKQLERHIYTGEKSLVVFLEDIRVDDIIEYSYSIKSQDPQSLKDFYQGLYVAEIYPVSQMRYRLLWPKEEPLAIKNHNLNIEPKIKYLENKKEYTWEFKNIDVISIESGIPSWYIPYAWVEVGTKKSWNDVARKQLNNYKVPENISKALSQFILDIKKHKATSDQLIAAMRFIQNEVRYMSIPEPRSPPADPSTVFQRRYGDCRDKALLALTILKDLGIKASPALVHTRKGKFLHGWLPHASAFNHVIILVTIQGKRYWFDPTIPFEGGNLENLTQSDYGYSRLNLR